MDKKRNKEHFFYSQWFFLALVGITALVIFAYARAFYQDYMVRKEIDQLKRETQQLEGRKIETLELLKSVKSVDFVERKARLELNLVKPGEKVVVFNSSPTSSRQIQPNMIQTDESQPWQKWWDYFFKQQ